MRTAKRSFKETSQSDAINPESESRFLSSLKAIRSTTKKKRWAVSIEHQTVVGSCMLRVSLTSHKKHD